MKGLLIGAVVGVAVCLWGRRRARDPSSLVSRLRVAVQPEINFINSECRALKNLVLQEIREYQLRKAIERQLIEDMARRQVHGGQQIIIVASAPPLY